MLSGRALLRATAVYNVGPYVGGGTALILGSMALRHFTTAGGMYMPLIGHLEPWQSVFLVLGLPGILLAALILALVTAGLRWAGIHWLPALVGGWLAYAGALFALRGVSVGELRSLLALLRQNRAPAA